MDTITQILLGGAVGHVVGGRRLGRLAVAAGAAGGLIPDLDVLYTGSAGGFAAWEYHRGVTHSLFFGPVIGTLLGWLSWKLAGWRRPGSRIASPGALGTWIGVWVMALVTHPLLDTFTVYGTQLLAPFTRHRFAFSGVAIIDPIYSVPMALALLLALIWPRRAAALVATSAILTLTTAYLFYGLAQNERAAAEARRQLRAEGVAAADLHVYTTMFNPWLRRVVLAQSDRFRIGFLSTWAPAPIRWHDLPRDPEAEALKADVLATPEGEIFSGFAVGPIYATFADDDGGPRVLRLLDMRYGFPGDTLAGFWGMRAVLDPSGGGFAALERLRVPRDVSMADLEQLALAALGRPNRLF